MPSLKIQFEVCLTTKRPSAIFLVKGWCHDVSCKLLHRCFCDLVSRQWFLGVATWHSNNSTSSSSDVVSGIVTPLIQCCNHECLCCTINSLVLRPWTQFTWSRHLIKSNSLVDGKGIGAATLRCQCRDLGSKLSSYFLFCINQVPETSSTQILSPNVI